MAAVGLVPAVAEVVRFALYTDLGMSGYINNNGPDTASCISNKVCTYWIIFCDTMPCVGKDSMLKTATFCLPANTLSPCLLPASSTQGYFGLLECIGMDQQRCSINVRSMHSLGAT